MRAGHIVLTTELDLFDRASIEDPYPLYRRLRETSPVHRVPGTDFFLVSTAELVEEAAARTEDFSSNLTHIMAMGPGGAPEPLNMDLEGALEHVLATADGAAHKLHRTFVLKALGRRIRLLESEMEPLTRQFWDEHAVDGRIEWTDAVADRLPPTILALLLGLPESEVPHLLRSAYESVELLGGVVPPERMDGLVTSTLTLVQYLEDALRLAVDEPRDGLLGVLAAAHARGEIEVSTAVLVLMQLVGAGAETTAGLIGTAARLLATRPDLFSRLQEDRSLIDPFLDECLRIESPLRGHYRVVTRDTRLGGVDLPARSHLLLLWGAANRDPARFPHPDEVDLDRAAVRQHLAFGKGTHFCVGSSLARFEATAAVRVLLDKTSSLQLDPTSPPRWVESVIVRRHARLPLTFVPR